MNEDIKSVALEYQIDNFRYQSYNLNLNNNQYRHFTMNPENTWYLNTTPVKPQGWVGCQILKQPCQISHPSILVELAHESPHSTDCSLSNL